MIFDINKMKLLRSKNQSGKGMKKELHLMVEVNDESE
jgi:hypothetical protein